MASYDSGSTSTIHELVRNMKRETKEDSASSLNLAPKISATCYSSRRPGYYIFNAYLLIFLITTSSLTIFSINPKLPQNRLQTSYTLLLTSVSFKWVINRYLPTVSYLTSLDKYAIACISYLCLCCVWHAVVGTFWSNSEAQRLDMWLLIACAVLLLTINVWVIVWFIFAFRRIKKLQAEESRFLKNLESSQEKLIISL